MTQKRGGCHLWETRMLLKAVCAWDDIHISVQTLIAIVITAWIPSTCEESLPTSIGTTCVMLTLLNAKHIFSACITFLALQP